MIKDTDEHPGMWGGAWSFYALSRRVTLPATLHVHQPGSFLMEASIM